MRTRANQADVHKQSRGMTALLLLPTVAVLAFGAYALAQGSTVSPSGVVRRVPATAGSPSGIRMASPAAGQPTRADIDKLQAKGYGLDDVMTAFQVAQRAGVTAESLLAQRKTGKSWNDIVQGLLPSRTDTVTVGGP